MGMPRNPWASVSRNPTAGPTRLNGDTGDGTAFGPQRKPISSPRSSADMKMARAAGLPASIRPTKDVLRSMTRKMTKILRKPAARKPY